MSFHAGARLQGIHRRGTFPPARKAGSDMQARIKPNLWFDAQAEEAADFYVSVFENSRIVERHPLPRGRAGRGRHGDDGRVRARRPALRRDQRRAAVHLRRGGLLSDHCEDQDEVDYYWEKLSDGGEEGPCGWLKDRYGLSWQVVPDGMEELFADPDEGRASARCRRCCRCEARHRRATQRRRRRPRALIRRGCRGGRRRRAARTAARSRRSSPTSARSSWSSTTG